MCVLCRNCRELGRRTAFLRFSARETNEGAKFPAVAFRKEEREEERNGKWCCSFALDGIELAGDVKLTSGSFDLLLSV